MKIQETLEPTLVTALMANFPSSVEAVLELVDNAADDWEGPIQKIPISVFIEIGVDELRIESFGEIGMGIEELRNFLRWGYSRKTGRIGQWGQGGKAACGYLASGLRIECTKRGEDQGWVLDDAEWDDNRSEGLKTFEPIPLSSAKDEAFVKLTLYTLKRNLYCETLLKRLSDVYRPLLKNEMFKILIRKGNKGQSVAPRQIPLRSGPNNFDILLTSGRRLHGWIGILEPKLGKGVTGFKGGARCYHYGRLITEGEYFGQPGPSFKASLNSLIAEVYLDFSTSPNLNKTGFDKDSPEWKEVEAAMYSQLKPWVRQLLGEKEEEVSTEEKEEAREAFNRVLKALKELELRQKGVLGEAQGQKPPEPNPEPTSPPKTTRDPYGPQTPSTSPPEGATGTRQRLGGADLDLQPGDGSKRSWSDSKQEKRKIVVYTKYPGYQAVAGERRGRMIYLMETFALELAKPAEDETKSIDDYWQGVNDILALASKDLVKAKE